jgi:hypothetical protein
VKDLVVDVVHAVVSEEAEGGLLQTLPKLTSTSSLELRDTKRRDLLQVIVIVTCFNVA